MNEEGMGTEGNENQFWADLLTFEGGGGGGN